MKKTWIWCSLVLLSLATAAWSQDKKMTGGGTEKAVAALEQQWLQAQKTNNPDLLAPLLADKVVVTEADGRVNGKAETLAMYKKTKWDSAEYTDLKVTAFGGTAIATGGFKGKGTDDMGKPFDLNERWTDTWVKMPSGQWQCVASQATPAKM
jgi:ketosteroid isomerase-like protein